MKRFVVCLDGTWNNASREIDRGDGSPVFRPTNVLKLARAVKVRDSKGTPQVTHYDAGVGAMNRAPDAAARIVQFVDNTVGGGWGAGFEVNIEEAYTFLANNYTKDDEIFVFGFSRGAAQARSLCRLIDWAGGFPTKNDAYYVPLLYSPFLQRMGEGRGAEVWKERNARREARGDLPLDERVPARIVFLGVWDTVLALGSRLRAKGGSSRQAKRFHVPSAPPPYVEHVRHALAIDETRHDFQAEVFEPGHHPSLEQRWFAGAHSNVGGGLNSDGLANCALRWIVQGAGKAGLEVREDFLEYFREFPQDVASTRSTGFAIADTLLRPLRGYGGVRNLSASPGMTLDDSVFDRLNADPAKWRQLGKAYRPENLLAFLAANPSHDARLSAGVRGLVEARRKS
jgi:uncharacterized protein (DUF2235 family)